MAGDSVLDIFCGSGGFLLGSGAMKPVIKLIEVLTGLLFVIVLGLAVWGLLYR
jgi:hypothetical protein